MQPETSQATQEPTPEILDPSGMIPSSPNHLIGESLF